MGIIDLINTIDTQLVTVLGIIYLVYLFQKYKEK